jgi:WG containing repeat
MIYLSRTILALICLTILIACESAKMQEKQVSEIQSETTTESNNLFPVRVNKKYGFIDKTGKIVIEPNFEFANDFVEGLALVGIRNDELKLVYIDTTGKVILSQQNGGSDFSEGLAAFGVGEFLMHGNGDHKFGFIDTTGQLAIEINFRETRAFSEDLSAVMNDERKWGYIDKTGKLVIPFQFEDAFSFSEGLACVLSNGLFGFIDKSGKIVIEPRFAVNAQFKEGLALVEIAPKNFKAWTNYGSYGSGFGKLVFIDKSGNEAIKFEPNVKGRGDFSEGFALVEIKQKGKDFQTGFIDKTGKVVIKLPFYSIVGKFSERLSVIENNGKYGFIDNTGKIIVKPRYRDAENFNNGLAKISVGKQIWDLKGTNNLGFEPKFGYIDKTGKVIWKPTN